MSVALRRWLAFLGTSGIAMSVGCGGSTLPLLDFTSSGTDDAGPGEQTGSPYPGSPDESNVHSPATTDAASPTFDASSSDASRTDAGTPHACVPIGHYATPPGFAVNGAMFALAEGYRYTTGSTEIDVLAVGDVTGDGRPDVVGRDASTGFTVYTQTANGSLIAGDPLDVGIDRFNWSAPLLIDADGDATLDILMGRTQGLYLIHSLGSGKFGDAALIAGPQPTDLLAYDHDGDGRLDVIGIHDEQNQGANVELYRANAAGSFDPAVSLSSPVVGPASWLAYPALGDVTGDGLVDLVATSGGAMVILPGKADGTFDQPIRYPLAMEGFEEGLAVGDIDGDGAPEVLVSVDGMQDNIWKFARTPDGGFNQSSLFSYPTISDEVAGGAIIVTDINLDGRNDVVTVDMEFTMRIFLGIPGGLGPPRSYPVPTAASVHEHALAVGDVNCDGCPDVVTSNVGGLVVFLGQGCASVVGH